VTPQLPARGKVLTASFFLGLAHASIGHRLVHAGVGMNLGAVERHVAKLASTIAYFGTLLEDQSVRAQLTSA
jgi:hypothetical protein